MAITYHAGRRIQGLDSEKTYLSASNTYNSTATANTFPVTLGGGSGSGNTKVGFEVSTGHSLVGQYLNTIQVKLAKYGTVSGTGYMSVYDSSGTLKSSSSTYNLSTLPNEGSEAYYTFTFSPPQSIANGDRIVLEGGTFNTSNQVDLYGESSNTDSNTNSVRYNSGWISESASDIHFIATTYDSITINPQSGSRFEATDTRKIYYYDAGYTVHTFTTTGSDTFQITSGSGDVEYLVVAGGGGGGGGLGGGGGAGGFKTGTVSRSAGSYTVTVGAGGAGSGASNSNGGTGSDSIFDTITSNGGGYGSGEGQGNGGNGGSGGASGGGGANAGGSGIAGQGNDGADSTGNAKGGGGGAGAAGNIKASANIGGAGGVGLQSSISGSATYYAGGGGGASWLSSTQASGGLGGGGNGSESTGYSGTANTGGGGGGGGELSGDKAGGAGGSGIVIIRYKNSTGIVATGGTKTIIEQGYNEEV